MLEEYSFPDKELLADNTSSYRYVVWQPPFTCVVIGRSNSIEDSVFPEQQQKIRVIQRQTGGQAVVLSPKMLAVSILEKLTEDLTPSQRFFQKYNQVIIHSLQELGVENIEYKGISDIVVNGKKIAGTAMFRNQHKVFYHAILNIAEDPEIIEKYLLYPKKTPEYRQGRSHREFVTSLLLQGYSFSIQDIQEAIERNLASK